MALFLLRLWLLGPLHALDCFQVVFRHHVFSEQPFDQGLGDVGIVELLPGGVFNGAAQLIDYLVAENLVYKVLAGQGTRRW